MEQSPWEVNRHLVSQEIPSTFMEPECSLSCSQDPTIGPYPEPAATNPHFPTLFPYETF